MKKIDGDLVFRIVLLGIALILVAVSIKWSTQMYDSVDTQDVIDYLASQGYTNISVGEKVNDLGGFGSCDRYDIARFDFQAVGPDNRQHNDLCVCVGSTMAHPKMAQLVIRLK